MAVAAIYARKSTEQTGVADAEKSVARQVAHAKAYATKKGWTVAEEHIFVDDGVSGAEFVKRAGFIRLMTALSPRPPFQVLIMSEESRLGREQIETAYALKQIIDAGVRVFFYLEDRERTLDSAMDKVMLSLTTFAAEMEREKARLRTYDAMVRKAKALHVTGGKVYGYDNVAAPGPDGRRAHVVRVINPEQASILRRTFTLYAAGLGLKRIAATLNAEHVPPPRANGWAPSAIREILHRPLYRGVIVWNRSQKVHKRGTKTRRTRAPHEWLRLEAPALRIVADELWNTVHARLERAARALPRAEDGRLLAGALRQTRGDGASPYLLTGFVRCAQCDGALGGMTQLHGRGPAATRQRVTHYGCTFHRQRGEHVCGNRVVIRTEIVDRALCHALSDLLQARAVDLAVDRAIERLRMGRQTRLDRRAGIERELRVVDSKLTRLTNAVATSDDAPGTLVAAIRSEEQRKRTLSAELATLASDPATAALTPEEMKRLIRERAGDVHGLFERNPDQARRALSQLFPKKLTAHPVEENGRRGYRLVGEVNVAGLLPDEFVKALEVQAQAEQPLGGGPISESAAPVNGGA